MGSENSSSKERSYDNSEHSSHSNICNGNSGNSISDSKEEKMRNEEHNSNSSSKIIRTSTSIITDFIPVVSNVKALFESIKGEDPITGEKLDFTERIVSGACAVLPGGSAIKNAGKVSFKFAKTSSKAEKFVKNMTKIEKEVKEIKNLEKEVKEIKNLEKEVKEIKNLEKEVKEIKNLEKEVKNLERERTFTKEENFKYYTEKKGYAENQIGGSGKPKIHNVYCKNQREAKEIAKNAGAHGKPPILHSAHYDKVTGEKKIDKHYHPSDNKGNPKPVHYCWKKLKK